MAKSITYVGLDRHKQTIAVALAETGLRGEVREYGTIPNTPDALQALTVKDRAHGWRRMRQPTAVPSSTFSAANSVVLPWH
jgi:hypothetical protein